MFFKTATIYKSYSNRKAAETYVARNFANNSKISIQSVGDKFMVVAE
jgi:hypothetical protein